MALSNGTTFNSGPLVFLSPRGKDKNDVKLDKPYFSISRVGADGKIAQTDETCTQISGDLVKLEIKDREIKGKIAKHAVLYIRDTSVPSTNETYYLDLTFGIASRGLFNSLLGLSTFTGLSIDLYRNKKGYESYGLKQGTEQVKWKYQPTEIPKPYPILNRQGVLEKNDYSEIDEFFEKDLKALSEKIGGKKADSTGATAGKPATAPAATAAKPAVTASVKQAVTAGAPADDDTGDQVPF